MSSTGHHKHSYYLTKNGDLRGFEPKEIETIALVARVTAPERGGIACFVGVVRDPQVHADVLRSIVQIAQDLGCSAIDLMRSPIEGPAGNVEFLIWLRPGAHHAVQPMDELIRTILI